MDDDDDDMGDNQNILAGVDDEDDDAAVRDILSGGAHPEGGLALPDFEDDEDYGGVEDDDDREIQQLIKGAGGLNNEELYRKIKKTVNQHQSDTLPLESNNLIEHVDEDGNVYLVDAQGNIHFPVDDEEANHLIIDGDGGDLDDEEFLALMEQEAMLRGNGHAGAVAHGVVPQGHNNNSTIINSSQNTSLEDNFVVE